jgi:serine/threonine protein phosphatase 1
MGGNADREALELWCWNGGDTTLAQLGIGPNELRRPDLRGIAARLRERLGPDVVGLLEQLPFYHRVGDYLLVHAGVDPYRPLAEQGPEELLWIREPFLDAPAWPHPFAVVHGHTILGPEVLPHRVGLDSGCFATGILTAAEIADDRLRFHAVASDPGLRALRDRLEPGRAPRFGEPEALAAPV